MANDLNGKSKLGSFIKKAGAVFPNILNAGIKLASGDVLGAVQDVSGMLSANKNHEDPKAREQAITLLNEFEIRKEELTIEALKIKAEVFKIEVDDRKNARVDGDRKLQRIVAYFSLIGFTVFGVAQLYVAYQTMVKGYQVNEFVIMTVSNMFGIFTGLLFTLKDFLFGGSMEKK